MLITQVCCVNLNSIRWNCKDRTEVEMEREGGPAVQKARSSFSENLHCTTFPNFTPAVQNKWWTCMTWIRGTCMKVTSDKVTHEPLS